MYILITTRALRYLGHCAYYSDDIYSGVITTHCNIVTNAIFRVFRRVFLRRLKTDSDGR